MSEKIEGGCQCGRVRFTVEIDDHDSYLCHCRMCQRASGGVSMAFKNVPQGAVKWHTDPDWYESSPIARRPFCSKCGTSLGFEHHDSEHVDVTIGSLDDPSPFSPTHHFGAESLHEAWLDTSGLPRKRTDEYQPLVDKWKDKVGKLPE